MPVTSAPPPPPKTRAPKTAAPVTAATKTAERTEGLIGWGEIGQAVLIGFRHYADAGTVGIYFPKFAEETAKLATENEAVAKFVDPLIMAGPYSAILAAALPMALQLAVNHGYMKPGAMGTVAPDMISARIETEIARAQVQALREQQEMEAEAERLQEELRRAKSVVPARVTAT